MDSKEKVFQTIEKLFALARNNSNENEAKTAALFAQRLMEKHGITEEEVILSDSLTLEEEVKDFTVGFPIKSWAWKLQSVVAPNFRTIAMVGRMWKNNSIKKVPCFRGCRTHSELALKTFQELYIIGETIVGQKLFKQYKKMYGTERGWADYRDSWLVGYVEGIKKAFENQVSLYALVLVLPEVVKESVKGVGFEKVSNVKVKMFHSDAYSDGERTGRDSVTYGRRLEEENKEG